MMSWISDLSGLPGLAVICAVLSVFFVVALVCAYFLLRSFLRASTDDNAELAALRVERDEILAEKSRAESWLRDHADDLRQSEALSLKRQAIEEELAQVVEKCAQTESQLDSQRKEGGELQSAVVALQTTLKGLEEQRAAIQKEIEASRAACAELTKTHAAANEEVEAVKRNLTEVRDVLADHQSAKDEIQKEIGRARVELEMIRSETASRLEAMPKLESQIAALKREAETLEDVVGQVKQTKNDLDALTRDVHAGRIDLDLIHEKKVILEADIKKLEHREEIKVDAYASLEQRPTCLRADYFSGLRAEEDEERALDTLRRSLSERNLAFSERVVRAFHTSLKVSDISSLTVLAGVSGTGKTRLPIEYAQAMGMHCLVMSVQPRWDSPQDMLGFFNFVEQRYEATELAKALVAMDPFNFKEADKVKDSMLLVLLDEMNLARVEYYFSEFLSKLELRRVVGDPNNASDRARAEVVIDSGRGATNKRAGTERRLWVPENVIFVGTMNEDETTQTLSDKVLDRANVIRFGTPRPKDGEAKPAKTEMGKQLPFTNWKKWQRSQLKDTSAERQLRDWWDLLNQSLEQAGRPIGYRVQDAMLAYVRNYPGGDWRGAFSDQLEYKIFPKLRGMSMEDEGLLGVIKTVRDILSSSNDEEFITALDQAIGRANNSGARTFLWQGVTRRS